MQLSDEEKNMLGESITQILANALQSDQITSDDAAQIADIVLSRIDTFQTQLDVEEFLKSLTERWPIFSSFLMQQTAEVVERERQQGLENVSALLKESKIEEALNISHNLNQLAKQGEEV